MAKSLNSVGLALSFLMAVLSTPAFAYDINSYAYADGPDQVAGYSYTDLDADDFWNYQFWEANAAATIWTGGVELDYNDVDVWGEPGDEIDAQAPVEAGDGYGWYVVVGDHYAYSDTYGWLPLGETVSNWVYLAPCTLPPGETETYTYPSPGSGPPYTTFYMTLSTYSFMGRSAQEQWAGGDPVDVCSGANLQAAMSTPQFLINSSNGYVDIIGENPGVIQNLRQIEVNYGDLVLPCGFQVFQNMMMLCEDGVTWGIWETDEIDVNFDLVSVTAIRNGQGGTFGY